MKQFLRHIFLLLALCVATNNLFAQTYNGGTWYSLYDANVYENKDNTFSVFSPTTGSLTFQWKKTGWLVAYPIYNLTVSESSNGSNYTEKYKLESGAGKKQDSYVSVTTTVSENITHLKFEQDGSLNRFYKDIKLPLAKHILLNNGTSLGTNSLNPTDNNLATSVGVRSINAYTIPLRSFFTQSGKITITSNNSEFHFSDGSTSKTFTLPTNNFCASASATGSYGNNWQNISNFQEKIYFTPSVNINGKRSSTIIISDGTLEAQIVLSAPVIPTYFFKAEAIASPAEGGTATATFANSQNTYSLVANDYATASMSAAVTFTATPNTANGYVFEGWKTDPASSTFYKQGADKTSFTETITSSELNPNGLESQLTYYAIYSRKYTAKITGSNYSGKLVNDSWQADYQFVNTQTAKPTNSEADPFYFKIQHDFTGNDSREGSPSPDEVIAYDPATNTITALNEGVATITFYQKETNTHEAVTSSYTVEVGKYTPSFTWNAAKATYYYGTSIPNIFSTTNPDVEPTFTSDNEGFARVENNTLYIANARETATITAEQKENYKWNGKSEQYVISPVNGNNHVPFTIDSEAKFNTFKHHAESGCKWSSNRVMFDQGGFDWDDNYYDIHFEGIPDKLTFNFDADDAASGEEWYVKESSNGTDWSSKTWSNTSNSGSASVTLQSSTRYLRLCYSGNLNGYISNIKVTERFQFEVTPTAIDFGTNGINHGQQEEEITFLHTNAGRITKAVIAGDDAKYFTVTPELIPGTGRDLYGSAKLKVTFDNLGESRGTEPYNATLTISDNVNSKVVELTGIRDGKSTPVFVWNPNAMPYYFNTTIANIAYSSNKDANCPFTFRSSDETIAKVENGDLYIYGKGQEVTITVSQPENADYLAHEESFTFTPCERPSLVVPFRVSQALHTKSVQLGTKCKWLDDSQIQVANPGLDGFLYSDDRKRVLITFAGVPDKLYFEFCSQSSTLPPTPENATDAWIVEESPNGADWTRAWKTSNTSTDWVSSGEISLKPNTQYVRFSYKGNFAGLLRNIIISSLEGNSYLRAEEGGYLSRGAKWGTQAIVDPFGMVCRVSHFTVDNTNIYTRFQFIDNMQYLWETHDTKELFTDDQTAANTANLWQIKSDASGKFTIQSGNDLGNKGQYVTLNGNALTLTDVPSQATIWHMESPNEHAIVLKNYMDAAAARAAEHDFGAEVNTLDKVRSNLDIQDFEKTNISLPDVALAEQSGEYRDGKNGTLAVYDNSISGLTPGFYRLTVKAFYRISESKYAQAAQTNNWTSVLAYVYANDVKYPIQSVYTSYNASSYDPTDELYNQRYYPTRLQPSAERALQEVNRYLNDVYVYVEADPGQTTGTLTYGIKNPSFVPGAWLAYSTITLTHFGRKEYIFEGDDVDKPQDWATSKNWNRGDVPNQYHVVTVKADVDIDETVEVYRMNIDEGKHVRITHTGGLTLGNGGIVGANDGSVIIDNIPEGAGYLRISPNAKNRLTKQVKVNYETMAYNKGTTRDEVWQYVGAPGTEMQMNNVDNTLIYHWDEQKGWIKNSNTTLEPFVGYALTQDQAPRGVFEILATPIFGDKKIDLTLTPKGMNGDNLFVNSYLAPIDVARIDPNNDYKGIEGTFYLFNSGSWKDWQDGDPNSVTVDGSPGQYFAITPGSAALIDANEDQTTIPPMQGAYVIAQTNDAWLNLNYEKHVYAANPSTLPMRAPQMEDDSFMRVRIQVNSQNSGADRMYVIQHSNCTSGYDNGFDARNIMAEDQVNIYTSELDGQMEISVSDQIDSTYIGFSAGSDNKYVLRITSVVGELYLKDLVQETTISLNNEDYYEFYAEPHSVNEKRFLLLENNNYSEEGDGVTTDLEDLYGTRVWMVDNMVYVTDAPINSDLVVYTIGGVVIAKHQATTSHYTLNMSDMPTGVYMLRLNDKVYKFVCK